MVNLPNSGSPNKTQQDKLNDSNFFNLNNHSASRGLSHSVMSSPNPMIGPESIKERWISKNSYLTYLHNLNKIDFLQNNSECYAFFKTEAKRSIQNGRSMWLLDYSKMFAFY